MLLPEIRQSVSDRYEFQSHAIVTPALASGWRAILENMPLMASTAGAVVFDTEENERKILFSIDMPRDRLGKTGPSAATVIFMSTFKQREIACCTHISAVSVFVIELAAAGFFGFVFKQHAIIF